MPFTIRPRPNETIITRYIEGHLNHNLQASAMDERFSLSTQEPLMIQLISLRFTDNTDALVETAKNVDINLSGGIISGANDVPVYTEIGHAENHLAIYDSIPIPYHADLRVQCSSVADLNVEVRIIAEKMKTQAD